MLLPPGRGMSQMEHIPLGMVPGWDLGTRLYTAPSIARGAGPAANQQVPGATQGFPPQKNHIKQHRLCPNLLPQLPAPGKSFPFGLALPNSERSRTLPIPTARHRVSRLLPGPSRQRRE